MSEYLKEPLLASLAMGKYTLYNDETREIPSTEQIAIYAVFEYRNRILKYCIGIAILLLSELVGMPP